MNAPFLRQAIIGTISALAFTSAVAQTHQDIHLNGGDLLRLPLAAIDSMGFYPGGFLAPPEVVTGAITNISGQAAQGGGMVTSPDPCERGVCWSTAPLPTTADPLASAGPGPGAFVIDLTGLLPSTTYHVRAYATNAAGTAYGDEVSFTTDTALYQVGGGVTDGQGNAYPTVIIDGVEWMAENLRTTTFANGDPIPLVPSQISWDLLSSPGCCIFNNLAANDLLFGKIYNGYTVMDPRNVCPAGWHVSTRAEVIHLTFLLDPSTDTITQADRISQWAGGAMKTTGTDHWLAPVYSATNASGLGLQGNSERFPSGTYSALRREAYLWIGEESVPGSSVRAWHVDAWTSRLELTSGELERGFAVRCVKDQ